MQYIDIEEHKGAIFPFERFVSNYIGLLSIVMGVTPTGVLIIDIKRMQPPLEPLFIKRLSECQIQIVVDTRYRRSRVFTTYQPNRNRIESHIISDIYQKVVYPVLNMNKNIVQYVFELSVRYQNSLN